MMMTDRRVKEISDLVEREIESVTDRRVVDQIRALLVTPNPVERLWDWGAPSQRFTWTVLEHPESNTGIAFCSEGFGPRCPWGLVSLSGPHMSIGMDSSWFVSLEGAFRDSFAWQENNPEGYEAE
jgi:hypothetical protein